MSFSASTRSGMVAGSTPGDRFTPPASTRKSATMEDFSPVAGSTQATRGRPSSPRATRSTSAVMMVAPSRRAASRRKESKFALRSARAAGRAPRYTVHMSRPSGTLSSRFFQWDWMVIVRIVFLTTISGRRRSSDARTSLIRGEIPPAQKLQPVATRPGQRGSSMVSPPRRSMIRTSSVRPRRRASRRSRIEKKDPAGPPPTTTTRAPFSSRI